MKPIDFFNIGESRYARQEMIDWWDQELLRKTRVIVIGAGALGNEVLKNLALLGVGNILVTDFDVISQSNLSRMILFREGDVGAPKVDVVVKRVREINSEVNIHGVFGDLRYDVGLATYQQADLVFSCLDSVNARWALNRKCRLADVPLIDGGISDYHGLVARYDPHAGACYECNFTASTLQRFNRRYSCPFGLLQEDSERKVPTTSITTSVIAAYQVQVGLSMIHGVEGCLAPGERLMLYLRPFRQVIDLLPYNEECLAHQSLPEKVLRVAYPSMITVEELFDVVHQYDAEIGTMELGYDLVASFACDHCQRTIDVLKPKDKVFQHELICPVCMGTQTPLILHEIEEGSEFTHLKLARLGIPQGEILVFRGKIQKIGVQCGNPYWP